MFLLFVILQTFSVKYNLLIAADIFYFYVGKESAK